MNKKSLKKILRANVKHRNEINLHNSNKMSSFISIDINTLVIHFVYRYDYGNQNAMSPENPYAPGTPSRGKPRPSQPPPAPPSTGN